MKLGRDDFSVPSKMAKFIILLAILIGFAWLSTYAKARAKSQIANKLLLSLDFYNNILIGNPNKLMPRFGCLSVHLFQTTFFFLLFYLQSFFRLIYYAFLTNRFHQYA